MRIKCLHGYFIFEEDFIGEVSKFITRYGIPIVQKDDQYVFEFLENAPDYSIKGAPFLGTVATETFEGKPWEVMEANGFVFNFNTGLISPIASITQKTTIQRAGNYFVADGLILPGSVLSSGSKIKSYFGWFSFDTLSFRYSGVQYV